MFSSAGESTTGENLKMVFIDEQRVTPVNQRPTHYQEVPPLVAIELREGEI